MRHLLPLFLLGACAPLAAPTADGDATRSTSSPIAVPGTLQARLLAPADTVPGDVATWVLWNAPEGATVSLAVSLTGTDGSFCPASLAPSCMSLSAPGFLAATATVQPGGYALLSFEIPVNAPVDRTITSQVAILGSPFLLSTTDTTSLLDPLGDPDLDGLVNEVEIGLGTDPHLADTDGDGVDDGTELSMGTDPLVVDVDSDGDGVPDLFDPCPDDAPDDTDGDGVCDSVDACPLGDDGLDDDADGVPDACDRCRWGPDNVDQDKDSIPDACDACVFSDCRILVGFLTDDPNTHSWTDNEMLEGLSQNGPFAQDIIVRDLPIDAQAILESGVQTVVASDTAFWRQFTAQDYAEIESVLYGEAVGFVVEGINVWAGVDNSQLYVYGGVSVGGSGPSPFPLRDGVTIRSNAIDIVLTHPITSSFGLNAVVFSSSDHQGIQDDLDFHRGINAQTAARERSMSTAALIVYEFPSSGGSARAVSTTGRMTGTAVSADQVDLVANVLCWTQAWNTAGIVGSSGACGSP